MKEAFTKVYTDGYRAGYHDKETEALIDMSDKIEYVDLGLPSGTLWASEYEHEGGDILYLPYEDAEKMKIPTAEQWQELIEHCQIQEHSSSTGRFFYGVTFIGPNGNSVKFRPKGYMKGHTSVYHGKNVCGKVFFWIQDKENNAEHEKKVVIIEKGHKRVPYIELTQYFSGYKLPVRQVSTK